MLSGGEDQADAEIFTLTDAAIDELDSLDSEFPDETPADEIPSDDAVTEE